MSSAAADLNLVISPASPAPSAQAGALSPVEDSAFAALLAALTPATAGAMPEAMVPAPLPDQAGQAPAQISPPQAVAPSAPPINGAALSPQAAVIVADIAPSPDCELSANDNPPKDAKPAGMAQPDQANADVVLASLPLPQPKLSLPVKNTMPDSSLPADAHAAPVQDVTAPVAPDSHSPQANTLVAAPGGQADMEQPASSAALATNVQPAASTAKADKSDKAAAKDSKSETPRPDDAPALPVPQAQPALVATALVAPVAAMALPQPQTATTPVVTDEAAPIAASAATVPAKAPMPQPKPAMSEDSAAEAPAPSFSQPVAAPVPHNDKPSLRSDATAGRASDQPAAQSQVQDKTADAAAPSAQPAQPSQPSAAAQQPQPQHNQVPATAMAGVNPAPAPAHPAPSATVLPHVHAANDAPTPNLGALAVSIATRSQSGARQFDIRLDPPELGRVDVRLSIDAGGKTVAHMSAEQPQTLDLLQKDSASLTRALRDAGLDVSQNGLNFSLKGQDRQSQDGQAPMRGPAQILAATKIIEAAPSAASYRSSAGDARLDIHV